MCVREKERAPSLNTSYERNRLDEIFGGTVGDAGEERAATLPTYSIDEPPTIWYTCGVVNTEHWR
jgi:hypothetical protein